MVPSAYASYSICPLIVCKFNVDGVIDTFWHFRSSLAICFPNFRSVSPIYFSNLNRLTTVFTGRSVSGSTKWGVVNFNNQSVKEKMVILWWWLFVDGLIQCRFNWIKHLSVRLDYETILCCMFYQIFDIVFYSLFLFRLMTHKMWILYILTGDKERSGAAVHVNSCTCLSSSYGVINFKINRP